MKILLRIIGITGLALFATLFALTFVNPNAVEASVKGYARILIAEELKIKLRESPAANLADKALHIAGKLGYDEPKLREDLNENLPNLIAGVIADMCGSDYEKNRTLTKSHVGSYLERIANFKVAGISLGEMIKDKYLDIVGRLRADLRIFLGSNAVIFLILLSISFVKPNATAHLFLPAVLSLVATVTASSIYIFSQNWFYTLLFNPYMGYGYLAYIGVIFGLLMDIAVNKARICTEIIRGVLNALGFAVSVKPC